MQNILKRFIPPPDFGGLVIHSISKGVKKNYIVKSERHHVLIKGKLVNDKFKAVVRA